MRVLGAPTPRPFRRSAVLANRVFRRLILGFAISFLGDGMSFVPVAWLAIQRRRPPRGCGSAARGSAGKYTLLAELLPDERRFAANTPRQLAQLRCPDRRARDRRCARDVRQLRARARAAPDALTYVFLAVLVEWMRLPETGHVSLVDQAAARGGLGLLRSIPSCSRC